MMENESNYCNNEFYVSIERQISCIYILLFYSKGPTLKPLFVLNIFRLVMVNYTRSQMDAPIVEQKLWENSEAAPASRSLHPPRLTAAAARLSRFSLDPSVEGGGNGPMQDLGRSLHS